MLGRTTSCAHSFAKAGSIVVISGRRYYQQRTRGSSRAAVGPSGHLVVVDVYQENGGSKGSQDRLTDSRDRYPGRTGIQNLMISQLSTHVGSTRDLHDVPGFRLRRPLRSAVLVRYLDSLRCLATEKLLPTD